MLPIGNNCLREPHPKHKKSKKAQEKSSADSGL
jgi:hypothetical protein